MWRRWTRWIFGEITPRSCAQQDDDLEPPSLEIIRKYLSKGFGERLTSGEAAARKWNHKCFMKRSQTSYHSGPHVEQGERCCLDRGARVVHPRRIDHASDIAILAESHTRVETTVLNFVDAFVAVPLHPAEQPLNCAEVHELEGQGDYAFILWRVLGFRGEANPLVVAAVLAGAVLGFTLAWSNGSHTVGVTNEENSDTGVHEWIGIQYALRGNLAVMSLPAPFVTSACEALRPFTRRRCFESIKLARCAVGKAARVAKLYQKRRLLAGALLAALSGSFHGATKEKPEAPVGMVAVARFSCCSSLVWCSLTR